MRLKSCHCLRLLCQADQLLCAVKPAKREVHVNFYPENNVGYVERFAMIHDFVDAGTYQLRAYQKKSSDNSGSLLETASPEPLCIEL